MPRSLKNKELRTQMCGRLSELIDDHLKIEISELSKKLKYSNTTTLRKMLKGEAFPDTERLVTLALIKTSKGRTPNIHWLITGKGAPLLNETNKQITDGLNGAIEALPPDKAKALYNLLLAE